MALSDPKKPLIAVSGCLLGNPVRYDGTDKYNEVICKQLAKQFEVIAICPEVDAGLETPRPSIRLTGDPQQPLALGVDDPELDVTATLTCFASIWVSQAENISGVILKSRSPSCGLNDTPVYDQQAQVQSRGPGLFTRILIQHYPQLPVIDDEEITNPKKLNDFISRVKQYSS